MGFLGKYAAYRWVTSGRGGGDGGTNPLVWIMMALVVFALVVTAVAAAIDFVYTTVRSLILPTPHLGAVGLGVIFAGILIAVLGPYAPERAAAVFSEDRDFTIYDKLGSVTAVYLGLVIYYVATGATETGDVSVVQMIVALVTLYYLYLIYKITRLIGSAPQSVRYRMAFLLPITIPLAVATFDIPVISLSVGILEFEDVLLFYPLVAGYIVLKRVVEPHLDGAVTSTTQRSASTDPDPSVSTD